MPSIVDDELCQSVLASNSRIANYLKQLKVEDEDEDEEWARRREHCFELLNDVHLLDSAAQRGFWRSYKVYASRPWFHFNKIVRIHRELEDKATTKKMLQETSWALALESSRAGTEVVVDCQSIKNIVRVMQNKALIDQALPGWSHFVVYFDGDQEMRGKKITSRVKLGAFAALVGRIEKMYVLEYISKQSHFHTLQRDIE